MIIVIADDITGAAEIAAIGLRFGLRVKLVTDSSYTTDCDLLVYATDSRSMSAIKAIEETKRIAAKITSAGNNAIIFKKTDSVLRGHIVEELHVLQDTLSYPQVLLIPENPSRGRIIRDGIYYINEQPLHETWFSFDPEFPCNTSNVSSLLKEQVEIISHPSKIKGNNIFVANATSITDINLFAEKVNNNVLFAGGADFFTSCLNSWGYKETSLPAFEGLDKKETIIICGSTASNSLAETNYVKQNNVSICNMPEDVFKGIATPDNWINLLIETYTQCYSLIITINHPPLIGHDVASRLRGIIANATKVLIEEHIPQEIIIEGGATAFSILKELGWNQFTLTDEIDPGVVRMAVQSISNTFIILKPGSYSWGRLF